MFRLIVVSAIVAVALGDVSHLFQKQPQRFAPPQYSPPAVQHHSQGQIGILKQHSDISADGSYQYGYETENGISHQEGATIKQLSADSSDKSAQGSYSYTSPEGERVEVSYVADANGFQPQGSHIPTAPPIPEAIQRAIDYILAHPPKEDAYTRQQSQQYNQQSAQQYNQQPFGRQPHYG